jgi:hypothetical protein
MIRLMTLILTGLSAMPPCSLTTVSFHPMRVLAQKIAAVTDCGPSPVAF